MTLHPTYRGLYTWAHNNFTFASDARWEEVDEMLRHAVIRASIDLNTKFYISSGKRDGSPEDSYHNSGQAVDISRLNGDNFIRMRDEVAWFRGIVVGSAILNHFPPARRAEMISPFHAERFHKPAWPESIRANLIDKHRTYLKNPFGLVQGGSWS